jgi:5-methylcytosine-specific restriction endonuclease McrBC GTP-binding regulatory subunit McrB
MNTADRSIRSIDIALRRRFDVFECPPDRRVLERFYKRHQATNEVGSLLDGFERLNAALTAQLDRHHTVGHAFFMAPLMTAEHLRRIWSRKIGPLIEEYFFDQPDVAQTFEPEAFWPETALDAS